MKPNIELPYPYDKIVDDDYTEEIFINIDNYGEFKCEKVARFVRITNRNVITYLIVEPKDIEGLEEGSVYVVKIVNDKNGIHYTFANRRMSLKILKWYLEEIEDSTEEDIE